MRRRLLIVDDEPDILESFGTLLADHFPEAEVVTSGSPSRMLREAERHPFDLVLSDYVMPEMDGIQFLAELRRQHPETRTVLVTAFLTEALERQVLQMGGIDQVVSKPVDPDDLTDIVAGLVTRRPTAQGSR